MLVVGIVGKKRSGKDTTAVVLKDLIKLQYPSFVVSFFAFADALKYEVAYYLSYVEGAPPLEELYAALLDTERKSQFRGILQWWGTEFRKQICKQPGYWIDKVRESIESTSPDVAIITDVRFPEEASFVRGFDRNLLIKVESADSEDDPHPSEALVDSISADVTIVNPKSTKLELASEISEKVMPIVSQKLVFLEA